jgi:hypothetical protein
LTHSRTAVSVRSSALVRARARDQSADGLAAEARDWPAGTIGPVEPGHWVEADTYLPIKG